MCYGRSVVHQEWPAMEAGEAGDEINPWSVALFRTLSTAEPATAAEESAYSKWPSGVVFVFMLFFADSGERRVVQALQIGSVVALMASSLVVLRYLNQPYHASFGGLRPVAMERTLDLIDQALQSVDARVQPPCTDAGAPLTS